MLLFIIVTKLKQLKIRQQAKLILEKFIGGFSVFPFS